MRHINLIGFVLTEKGGVTMPDREKVIETLESCVANPLHRKGDKFVISFDVRFVNAIIELLKEQEAATTAESRLFHCEKCGYGIDDIYLSNEYDFDVDPHYCPNCGRKVQWDECNNL